MLVDDLLILLHHPDSGRRLVSATAVGVAMGGAMLCELVGQGRATLGEPGRRTSSRVVEVVDPSPTGDALIDLALGRMTASRSRRATVVIPRMARHLGRPWLDRMMVRGQVTHIRGRHMGLFPYHAWRPTDPAARRAQIEGLRQAIGGLRPPTEREHDLIALIHAVRATTKVLPPAGGSSRTELRRQAERTVADHPLSQVVRHAADAESG